MTKLNFIDFRKELELLRNAGLHHMWVALRCVDLGTPCTECSKVIDVHHEQPPRSCTSCLGIGYSFVDKLVKAYRYRPLYGVDTKTMVGVINTQTRVYILEHGQQPKQVDWILELELNSDNQPVQPFRVTSRFKIQDAMPMRGDDDGRIEYWHCIAEERNLDDGKATF